MPIVYYSGPEGSCKTLFMTRECLYHHSQGGDVFAFPGYQVLNNRGRVISKLLMPENWIGLLNEDVTNYVVAIDEMQNFLNHHKWYDQIVDLITYGAAAQRRKRNMAILATGPIFEWLPRDLRLMFHEVVRMQDRHWKDHSIPKGVQATFTREDLRGVLSGKIGQTTRPRIFYAKRYWKNMDTYAIIDPRFQFNKVKFERRNILVGADGKVIEPGEDLGTEPAQQMPSFNDRIIAKIGNIINSLKGKGVQLFPASSLYDLVRSQTGVNLSNIAIGRFLKSLKIERKFPSGKNEAAYILQ